MKFLPTPAPNFGCQIVFQSHWHQNSLWGSEIHAFYLALLKSGWPGGRGTRPCQFVEESLDKPLAGRQSSWDLRRLGSETDTRSHASLRNGWFNKTFLRSTEHRATSQSRVPLWSHFGFLLRNCSVLQVFDKYCHTATLDVWSSDLLHGLLAVGGTFHPVRILFLPIYFSQFQCRKNIRAHSNTVCSVREVGRHWMTWS